VGCRARLVSVVFSLNANTCAGFHCRMRVQDELPASVSVEFSETVEVDSRGHGQPSQRSQSGNRPPKTVREPQRAGQSPANKVVHEFFGKKKKKNALFWLPPKRSRDCSIHLRNGDCFRKANPVPTEDTCESGRSLRLESR